MMKLHGHPISPNSRRAELGLAEYQVPYTFVPVELMARQQYEPDFMALNPNCKVPVLEDGDFILSESNAILLYLAALHPERGLDGQTPRERGEVARWMFFNTAHLSPSGSRIFAHTVLLSAERRLPAEVEAGKAELTRCLRLVDDTLGQREWLLGPRFSLADLCLAPNLYFARGMLRYDLSVHANVCRWLDRVMGRPSWSRVYGTRDPD